MERYNVLIVDDDPNIRKLLHELLVGRQEYLVLVAEDGKQAVKLFTEERIDVVLTDIHMPGFTGLEMMADVKKLRHQPEILVMTANGTPENVEKARQIGARAVILKPFENLDIIEAEIEKAVQAVAEARAKTGSATRQPAVEPMKDTSLPAAKALEPEPPPVLAQPDPEVSVPKVAQPKPLAPSPIPARPKAPAPTPRPAAVSPPPEDIEVEIIDSSPDPGDAGLDEAFVGNDAMPAPPAPEPEATAASSPPAPAVDPADQILGGLGHTQSEPVPRINPAMTARMEIPEIDAWKADLVGNETPEPEMPSTPPAQKARPVAAKPTSRPGLVSGDLSSQMPQKGPAGKPAPRPAPATPGAAPKPGPPYVARPAAPAIKPQAPQPVAPKPTAPSAAPEPKAATPASKWPAARPAPRPPPPPRRAEGGLRARIGFPDLQTLKAKLFGRGSEPDTGGSLARSGGEALLPESDAVPNLPDTRESPARDIPESVVTSTPATPDSMTMAIPVAPASANASAALAADFESDPPLPAELESIFSAGASLAAGKMKMQVPIVCLQTWEEQLAIATLRRLAAALQREFHIWSATKGIVKDDGDSMGEMYCEPVRALEFIRRHKQPGLYVLVDFRNCLEDRTVVRALREMVMEGETACSMLVLIAPVLAVPPELQTACKHFDWPAAASTDFGKLLEEVQAEVGTSSGRSIDVDPEMRRLLLERVQGMPAGRARFEFACALMARAQRGG